MWMVDGGPNPIIYRFPFGRCGFHFGPDKCPILVALETANTKAQNVHVMVVSTRVRQIRREV